VLDTRRDRLAASRFDPPRDFLGQRRSCHIDFADRDPQQSIAYGAADNAGFLAVAVKERKQTRDFSLFQPGRVGELWSAHLVVVPGTNLPFSICAGT